MRSLMQPHWRRALCSYRYSLESQVALHAVLRLEAAAEVCLGEADQWNLHRSGTHPRWWAHASQPATAGDLRGFAGSTTANSAVTAPVQEPSTGADDTLHLTDAAVQRLQELVAEEREAGRRPAFLRLEVEAGGCSGFSYVFRLDHNLTPTDRVFEVQDVQLVTDNVSYELVRGATVDYVQELIKSTFEVVNNPNAEGGCGCGSSFSPK